VETLFVGLSPVENPAAVAGLLSGSWPYVDDIECQWDMLEDESEDDNDDEMPERASWSLARMYRTRWRSVARMVPYFHVVREEER
ncbi:hypothetical protein BD413DRAFT_452802, partial [Trametes elegans]